jgi:ribosomal protein S18 acetylase RimI-like enzyme
MAENLRLLREAGAASAWLGVDMDNRNQALTLYEACGFRVVTRSADYRKPFATGEDAR